MTLSQLVIARGTHETLSRAIWSRLQGTAAEVVLVDANDPAAFRSSLEAADGVILQLGMLADRAFFDCAPNLRYLGMYGTGYGRIDLGVATDRGVTVTNVAGYCTESVAELVIGAALMVYRDLEFEHQRGLRDDFNDTQSPGRDLAALRIGVVGAGLIGRRVVEILSLGFGSRVSYWNRTRRPEIESSTVRFLELADLLKTSDLVSVHLAGNAGTQRLLNSELVAMLPAGSLLISTSPNEVVDLDAVLARCRSGSLRFVMDHADELVDSTRAILLTTPNIILLPPIGYATREVVQRKEEVLVENLESFLAGSPRNQVNG